MSVQVIARDRCLAFAKENLSECAKELLEWYATSVLVKDGKVRELAKMCSEFTNETIGLKIAENFIKVAALRAVLI